MKTKICTSLEQSKKLIELGIDINTADMHHVLIDSDGEVYDIRVGNYIGIFPHYPAWSLSALFDLFPNGSILRKSDKGKYFIFGNMFDNPIDTAFEMVCWLKENNKI